MTVSEHKEQANLIIALRAYWTRYPDLGMIYAVHNGGRKHIGVATKQKAEGTNPGVPDLCLPVPLKPYHGLYVEMKRMPYPSPETGKMIYPSTSKEQKRYIQRLKELGHRVVVPNNWEDALAEILCYIKLPRWEQ